MPGPKIKKEIETPVAARGLRDTQVGEWHTEDLDFDEDANLIIKNPKLGARLLSVFNDNEKSLYIILEKLPHGRSALRPMSAPGRVNKVRGVNPTNLMCPCEPVKP